MGDNTGAMLTQEGAAGRRVAPADMEAKKATLHSPARGQPHSVHRYECMEAQQGTEVMMETPTSNTSVIKSEESQEVSWF